MSDDETVGEVVDKVEALGTYSHVDSNGTVWHLKYLGEVQLETPPDGKVMQPFPTECDGRCAAYECVCDGGSEQ